MALIDTRISPCKPAPVESSSSCRTSQSLPDAKEIGEKLQPLGVEMRAETLKGWAWFPVLVLALFFLCRCSAFHDPLSFGISNWTTVSLFCWLWCGKIITLMMVVGSNQQTFMNRRF
jgi:hypothetical protein